MNRKDQIRQIEELLKKYDKRIAQAFLEGISNIQNTITLTQIEQAIIRGDIFAAANIITQAVVAASFVTFTRELQSALIAGGDFSEKIANANKIQFTFDVTAPSPARFFQDYKAAKVREISQDMQRTIGAIIQRGINAGENPRETARLVRDGLGLTVNQEQAVYNYRAYLDDLSGAALDRELRDKRYDRTIARAIKLGQPLSKEQKEKMTAAYRRKYINRRAETIARTETMTMVSEGREQFWQEAVKNGVVDQNRISREWIVTSDSRLRDAHAAIPRMNKGGVGLNEPFKSPLGLIRFPGDPMASAGNRINCRCTVFTRIK